jgi:hypothetical protein
MMPVVSTPQAQSFPERRRSAQIQRMDKMKQMIDWFEIPVSDMSRAQAFYEAALQTP